MFEWKDSYSVGIDSIDAQHKRLVSYVNDLFVAMSSGKASLERCKPILQGLIDYTKSHFAYEEELFKMHQYADAVAHKKEHDDLTAQVLKFASDLQAGRVALSIELAKFLKDWLTKHIQGTDMKYKAYLIGKGVK